jgi:hypothetical protein
LYTVWYTVLLSGSQAAYLSDCREQGYLYRSKYQTLLSLSKRNSYPGYANITHQAPV